MKFNTTVSAMVSVVLVGSALFFAMQNGRGNESVSPTDSIVSIVDGKQVIDITVKGGYSPRVITAGAGMPVVLRMKTGGTFDCSSALVIPSIGYRAFLPASGVTEIEIPSQEAGSVMQGTCSMGMYGFTLKFN